MVIGEWVDRLLKTREYQKYSSKSSKTVFSLVMLKYATGHRHKQAE